MNSQGARSDNPVWDDGSASAEAFLAAILDSTDDGIVGKGLNGIIRSWNRSAERIFGYTADEAIGKSILMLLPDERKNEEEMIFARIRRGERVEHFDTQRVRKDGQLIDVSVTISPILNQDGRVVGASKVARDISDRVQIEADRARLSAIIESSDDAIVSKDLKGIIKSWDPGAERLFGYMAEEMIGQSVLRLLPADRLDEEDRILSRLSRGEKIDHYETIRQHRDGRLLDVSVTISPIRDASGRIIGASKVARDISDRKVLEATMIHLREELEERVAERTRALDQANQEMESFTHSIAHDLRGPLRAIASTCSLLQLDFGDVLPDDAKELLERQIAASKRLAQLIEDLLRYSRLGRTAMVIESIDLTSMAEVVGKESGASKTGCVVQVEPDLHLKGDRILIRLMLQNLVENACKFSPDGGLVEVGRKGSTFFVKDSGVGFDMAYADKIFLPFERLVNNDEVPGTGIGLANVKRIIDKHGGQIWVNSMPGHGTTFFFTFPDAPVNV